MSESISDAEIKEFLALGVHEGAMVRRLETMEPAKIAVLLGYLRSTGLTGASFEAIRDSGRAIIDQKLTERLIQTLNKLDTSATRLGIVGIVLAAVIGIAGIVVPLLVHRL